MEKIKDKKRVLIYTDSYLKYSQTFIYNQLMGVSCDFEVKVLCSNLLNTDRFPFENVSSVSYNFQQKVQRIFNPYHFHSSYRKKLQRAIEEFNPNLIHAHFGQNGMKIMPVASKMGIPVIVTFHGSDSSKRLKSETYKKLLSKYLCQTKIVCCSNRLRLNLRQAGFDMSEANVLYIGASVSKFDYEPRIPVGLKIDRGDQVVFLQVGRFVEKKGHETTLRAFSTFLNKMERPDRFELRLIGDGPLESEITKLVSELGLKDQVKFLGVKCSNEVMEEMRKADVLLQHSVTASNGDMEGLPIVLMEAMATGMLVISTHHSGIPEIICHNENGFLVDERDLKGYGACLDQLLEIRDDRINRQAREKLLLDFNLKEQNAKLSELYSQVIHESVSQTKSVFA